jgi:hypothetical protein
VITRTGIADRNDALALDERHDAAQALRPLRKGEFERGLPVCRRDLASRAGGRGHSAP